MQVPSPPEALAGTVAAVRGAVVDVAFRQGLLAPLNTALSIAIDAAITDLARARLAVRQRFAQRSAIPAGAPFTTSGLSPFAYARTTSRASHSRVPGWRSVAAAAAAA